MKDKQIDGKQKQKSKMDKQTDLVIKQMLRDQRKKMIIQDQKAYIDYDIQLYLCSPTK